VLARNIIELECHRRQIRILINYRLRLLKLSSSLLKKNCLKIKKIRKNASKKLRTSS